jgi:hypothetical protein
VPEPRLRAVEAGEQPQATCTEQIGHRDLTPERDQRRVHAVVEDRAVLDQVRVNAMTPLSGMSAAFLKGPRVNGSYEEQSEWDPAKSAIPLKLDRPPGLADHARLALFLASEDSAYISGQAISLDGAHMARVGTQPAPVAGDAGAR